MNSKSVFTAVTAIWVAAALLYMVVAGRALSLVALPIAVGLWYAANSFRVKQSTQLVLPVLLLPGALMCFVGLMQAFGYGRMSDEPITESTWLRVAFFGVGLALHFAAYLHMANESRASDHLSGERATRV